MAIRKSVLIFLAMVIIAKNVFSDEPADEPERLGKIVITPSRLDIKPQENPRSVTILESDTLDYANYSAVPDAIGSVGGIDIRRRGPQGVQADINIRGSTFEQNTVMIDGVKVNDPQTGHFDMDLPIQMADVDKIEILKGPASSSYGPDAFGGVINIITKRPEGKSCVFDAEGGSFDYFRTAAAITYPLAALNNRFSMEESRSSGYMPDTWFNILSLSDAASIDTFLGVYDLLFGYTKKDFGAANFYSNLFPNEEEHTDTRFFKIAGEFEDGDLKITPKLFLRRHGDKFSLDRDRPGWQTNYSTTYTYGGELGGVLDAEFLNVAYGFELAQDTIDSTNLQTHSRTTDGLYCELSPKILDKLNLDIGGRGDYFSAFGWQFSPSVSASYILKDGLTARGSIGKGYRIPTFTDLYYNDSGNKGDPNLQPESAWNYEIGADYRQKIITYSATYFHRDSFDTIDWIRPDASVPWQASNIGTVNTNGLELSFNLVPQKTFMSYTVLDSYRKHDYLSKYALDYLKHQITAGTEIDIFGFKNYWVLNFKKRVGQPGALVVDAKLSKEIIRKRGLKFEVFLEASNLFDAEYSEQSGVEMPGRWIKSGGRIEF